MRRRDFIGLTLLGGAAASWPLAARAQQIRVARIDALYIGLAAAESFKKELREGLREVGYVEGQNIAFEFRSAEGQLDRLPGLAAELVRLEDVCFILRFDDDLEHKHKRISCSHVASTIARPKSLQQF
jgi:putative ABC transport system substrate-binding protein